jgi:hypothetical protein
MLRMAAAAFFVAPIFASMRLAQPYVGVLAVLPVDHVNNLASFRVSIDDDLDNQYAYEPLTRSRTRVRRSPSLCKRTVIPRRRGSSFANCCGQQVMFAQE